MIKKNIFRPFCMFSFFCGGLFVVKVFNNFGVWFFLKNITDFFIALSDFRSVSLGYILTAATCVRTSSSEPVIRFDYCFGEHTHFYIRLSDLADVYLQALEKYDACVSFPAVFICFSVSETCQYLGHYFFVV